MATSLYCSLNDVKNRLSTAGVTYRIDDTPPDATDGDVLDEASRIIDDYCLLHYAEAQLAVSPIVMHWTANIAAMLMCERRGNPVPVGIHSKYERTLKRLERVQLGATLIADIPMRKTQVPVLSNVRVRLDPFPRTVVEKRRSTGTPENYKQHSDKLDFLDYSI